MAGLIRWCLIAVGVLTPRAPGDKLVDPKVASCPGYNAFNVKADSSGLMANLYLSGPACNVYGDDILNLTLSVRYESENRVHVKIADIEEQVYQVPESVFPRPSSKNISSNAANILFTYTASPFSFSITRAGSGEVLFDTSAASIIFQSQYIRLRTKLPDNPNIYGLGEHSDPLRLPITNYVRTLWSQDSSALPAQANLYGNHPVYYEHRTSGSHGVFLLTSNGADIKISNERGRNQYLEYNTLGGVLDFYFLAGPTPVEVSKQYAEVVGLPAMMPYWSLGFHNCRYGYQDAFAAAEVIYNYSKAEIPLETMWLDIDYMDRRRVFTVDPDRFPISRMKAINDYLHAHDQKQIVMVDPGVAYASGYLSYERGAQMDVWLKRDNGSEWLGVVWPGVVVFPDWFSREIQQYWDVEFSTFFTPGGGVDIDGLWIDMNEPSNFPCNFPCADPYGSARNYPPPPPALRDPPRSIPGFPCDFQPPGTCQNNQNSGNNRRMDVQTPTFFRQQDSQPSEDADILQKWKGLSGRDFLYPKYAIHNRAAWTVEANAGGGGLSNRTVNTDVRHQNGLVMYDTHNLYGSMMSTVSQASMLRRRPMERPFVITRSTFAGAGAKVGKWLGDNVSDWPGYRISIRGLLAFTSIYQIPMVGSDVCGHMGDATEQLCTRWATLGAFSPFYRNHNTFTSTDQEFYRWESTTIAARNVIEVRYRLLDYIYTALWHQTQDGTPLLFPLFYLYPNDTNTYKIELQYFYGPGLLVSPVTQEDSTSVSAYFPKGVFYNYFTHEPLQGKGKYIPINNVDVTSIPLHYRGGVVFPQRMEGAMTTTSLRKKDFELIVALDNDGRAEGELYLDDGISIEQKSTMHKTFVFERGMLSVSGKGGFDAGVSIKRIVFLGMAAEPKGFSVNEKELPVKYNSTIGEAVVDIDWSLSQEFEGSMLGEGKKNTGENTKPKLTILLGILWWMLIAR